VNYPDDFDIYSKVFVKRYYAEQKMLYHLQKTVLAKNKLISSARKLHEVIADYDGLPASLKQALLDAIHEGDVDKIRAVSAQVQEALAVICRRRSR
jgi:hypothetical protein